MTQRTSMDVIQFVNRIRDELREQPVQLPYIRAKAAQIEEFAEGVLLLRSTLGEIFGTVIHYYTLPECIALYRRELQVYREHVERGDLDGSHDRNVAILEAHGLCAWWLDREERYAYGDVRLLRPLIGEVLIAAAEWPRSPHPDMHAELGAWYEALAPGGSLYPTDAHLDYVRRFEAFAEELVWDSRGQEYLTIVNFPAPPNAPPPTEPWSTQHIVR